MDSFKRYYVATFVWHRNMIAYLGHDIYDLTFKPGIPTILVYCLLFTALTWIIFTLVHYDNFVRINVTLIIGILIQVGLELWRRFSFLDWNLNSNRNWCEFLLQSSFKMYNVRYVKEFQHKIMFIKRIFQLHITTKSAVRLDLFARFALYNDLIVKCGLVMYALAVGSFFPYPIYMYFVKNERVPLLTLYISFVDENTYSGYITLLIIQTFLILLTVVGMAAIDILYAMMIINIPILARFTACIAKRSKWPINKNDCFVFSSHVHAWKKKSMICWFECIYCDYFLQLFIWCAL